LTRCAYRRQREGDDWSALRERHGGALGGSPASPLRLSVFVARVAMALAVFLAGIFAMAAVFDLASSTPWFLWAMRGFVDAPFELFLPLFLTGFILLAASGVSVAWGRRKTSVVLLAVFVINFWWTFFSHTLLQPGNLFWFPDIGSSWFARWSTGMTEDVEAFYSFLSSVGAFFVSRILTTKDLLRSVAESLFLGSVALGAFSGLLLLMAPGWWVVQVTNFESDIFSMDLRFVSNGLLFCASSATAVLSSILLFYFRRRQERIAP